MGQTYNFKKYFEKGVEKIVTYVYSIYANSLPELNNSRQPAANKTLFYRCRRRLQRFTKNFAH
jgi:hypothetical protein